MNMYDLIQKKRRGGHLNDEEINWLVSGVTDGSIPDYQLSAFLMAVCWRGMSGGETLALTLAMARSGDMMDLSALPGVKGDKHSTGGVGDKTTLIVAPVAAACGVTMAKMSGRGLGHTGGTVDKLEAIPGFQTSLSPDRFAQVISETGLCVVGQSGHLAPADKKLYALRDVTATVESLPLIVSSIMSKKLAAGADCILLDVKTGAGAFMKTTQDSMELARAMVDIGNGAGRSCAALVTDMEIPLGYAVGNALEVKESLEVLRGGGPDDLARVSIALAAALLRLAARRDPERFPSSEEESVAAVKNAISSGAAFKKFCDMVTAQGGDAETLTDPSLLPAAAVTRPVLSRQSGFVSRMDAEGVGMASVLLGAGRRKKEDGIDPGAGIVLARKTGDAVREGDVLAVLHTSTDALAAQGEEAFMQSVSVSGERPAERPLIFGAVE